MMEKAEARTLAKGRRLGIPADVRVKLEEKIAARLLASVWYKEADIVLSYASFQSEVSTVEINRRVIRDGKKLYLPKTFPDRGEMVFYETADISKLTEGYRGILEPCGSWPKWNGRQAGRTVMLMPGVAFDASGSRVGYGGGYYDRFLSLYGEKIGRCVMLAFEAQRTPQIHLEPWDKKPDKILTESETE